jgi:hypothetical protein
VAAASAASATQASVLVVAGTTGPVLTSVVLLARPNTTA